MSGLVREDPPNPRRGSNQRLSLTYADDLAKVKTEPGAWFRLIDYSIKPGGTGATQAFKAAAVLRGQVVGYEFKAASGKVYVRYMGGES